MLAEHNVAVELMKAAIGEARHVAFGPYEARPAGVYRVEFELAIIAADLDPHLVLARLDVCSGRAAVIHSERTVSVNELADTPRTFSLLVELPDIHVDLEYRIFTMGAGEFLFGQPRLIRVSGVLDANPEGELRLMEPATLAADTRRILRALEPKQLVEPKLVRLGNDGDGGYVCVDDFAGIDTAFSFGINHDISWDLDAADRGLRIYQFDHTVSDPAPDDGRMIFEAKMIAPDSGPGRQDLSSLIRLHDKHRDRPNIILKMDIEGFEWGVIAATPREELARIAWIVCELHYFQGLADPEHRVHLDYGLQALTADFSLVHVHSNVWGGYTSLANVVFPNVVEATLVNHACYIVADSRQLFPTDLDRSCDSRLPDFYLGSYRF